MNNVTAEKRDIMQLLGIDIRALPDHKEYVEELRGLHESGRLIVDPDDPRTTRGLSPTEVRYIRGEKE